MKGGPKSVEAVETSERIVSFGRTCRLVTDEYLASHFGVTLPSFRRWCRAMQVPMLHIGKRRFVNLTQFLLAVYAVTRIGAPDFLVPGCLALDEPIARRPDPHTTEVDAEELHNSFEKVAAEMMHGRQIHGARTEKEEVAAARRAADRMMIAMAYNKPQELINEFSKRASRKLNKLGFVGALDDWDDR